MADSAASSQSRNTRARSTRRRASTVSTETENKLARAARSAQRLAQLSDASRDDSTLDMFPDDPTRATLEAMNIDIRQGTLHGFELPDVVRAAVGVPADLDGVASGSSEARAARRAPREKAEAAYASVPLAGFERIEPTHNASKPVDEPSNAAGLSGSAPGEVGGGALPAGEPQVSQVGAPTLVSPSMAAASLVRSVTARRQEADASVDPAAGGKPGGEPPQRFAATFAKAATASREVALASGEASEHAVTAPEAAGQAKPQLGDAAGVVETPAMAGQDRAAEAAAAIAAATSASGIAVAPAMLGAARAATAAAATKAVAGATPALAAKGANAATAQAVATGAAATGATAAKSMTEANTATGATASKVAPGATTATAATAANMAKAAIETPAATGSARATAAPRANAPFAAPLHETAPTVPELDRARATAFADTVDALYGVISDQRRAATDHSRRMKWMLSIVVGALLMTVAIGITQTVLLMRLTRETTAQQHRIEQMMQNQQAAMTSLLDAHLAMANAAAATPAAASAPAETPHQAAAAAPASKRKAHTHAHKPKVAPGH
ncbi:MAG: hypothetical protein RXR20_15755 [Paraburkholderia sp.]|jgi:hypothetical protein|uniref:hypothetical protein n=2 Tax=Burkholderiales TaxID=80840 RepID=UPI0010F797BA|nr:hypothetical protein [Burkholderia sp. 4M9327F10]